MFVVSVVAIIAIMGLAIWHIYQLCWVYTETEVFQINNSRNEIVLLAVMLIIFSLPLWYSSIPTLLSHFK